MADNIVKSVNGKTGNVTLSATDIKVLAGSAKNIEQTIGSAYVATATLIDDDNYLLTITKQG